MIPCPHCYSPDTIWKPKAGKWEYNAWEKRFEGPAPLALSIKDSSGLSAKALQPRRIFSATGTMPIGNSSTGSKPILKSAGTRLAYRETNTLAGFGKREFVARKAK